MLPNATTSFVVWKSCGNLNLLHLPQDPNALEMASKKNNAPCIHTLQLLMLSPPSFCGLEMMPELPQIRCPPGLGRHHRRTWNIVQNGPNIGRKFSACAIGEIRSGSNEIEVNNAIQNKAHYGH